MKKEISAKSMNEAIASIIAKLCYPVADEIGNSLAEKTSQWRQKNILSILEKADSKISSTSDRQVHPRVIHQIIEEGSWTDDDAIKDMWAGILEVSCTDNKNDDSNLIFINILKNLSSSGMVILKYACENSEKYRTDADLIGAYYFKLEIDFLKNLISTNDVHRLDRELDQLRALELTQGGIPNGANYVVIALTSLALQLYVKGQGSIESPLKFFGVTKRYNKTRDHAFVNQWVNQ